MRAIGYVRVSTDEQSKEGISLAAQEEKIRLYCQLHGMELVRVVADGGYSGKNLIRPGIQECLASLRDDEADAIVVSHLDRLSRDVGDISTLLKTVFSEKSGKRFCSVSDSIDTRSASGRFLVNILSSIAQWHREAIVERTKEALRHKKERGERTGAVPYGKMLSQDGKTLIENDREQYWIEFMARRKRNGESYRSIAEQLNAMGVPTKQQGRWHTTMVRRILTKERVPA